MSGRCDIAVYLYEPGDGGLDRVAILLANGFAERGFKTELWLTRDEGPVRHLISTLVIVRVVPAPKVPRGLALLLQLPSLRRMVLKHRPSVLMSAGNQSNLAVALACCETETAAVAKITNPIDRPGASGFALAVRKWRFGMTARLSRMTLCLSEADRARYSSWFPRAALVCVANPYVTEAMIEGARTVRRNPVPRLLFVGRLAFQKDPELLLRALALMKTDEWQLDVVGEGPLNPILKTETERLGFSSRVNFAGFSDPVPFYRSSDLLVMSSRWEGMPASPIEAMASGCSVVATDCAPGLADLLRSAGLPPPAPVGDAAALAVSIRTALRSRPNPTLLAEAAASYTLPASVADHLALLGPFLKG